MKISIFCLIVGISAKEFVFRSNSDSICDPVFYFQGHKSSGSCALPLPNDFYLTKSSATPTGFRVNIPKEATFRDLNKFSTLGLNDRDGWSPTGFMAISGFPKEVAMKWKDLNDSLGIWNFDNLSDYPGFASHLNIEASMDDDSLTLLIDAETGLRIPHYVEEDKSSESLSPLAMKVMEEMSLNGSYTSQVNFETIKTQTLLIYPSQKLKNNNRYIVALRNLVDISGQRIQPPLGFKMIRDDFRFEGTTEMLEKRRKDYETGRIFELLDPFLNDRKELYAAWDFTTASFISISEPLRSMRDDATKKLRESGFQYEIYSVVDDYSADISTLVKGKFRCPLYLTTDSIWTRNKLVRYRNGSYIRSLTPVFQGWTWVRFNLAIPYKAIEMGNSTFLQIGHGIFSNKDSALRPEYTKFANENNYILAITDWLCFQKSDLITLSNILTSGDFSAFDCMTDRCTQGVLNQMMLAKFLRESKILFDPMVFYRDEKSLIELDSHNNAKYYFFYGMSLGGILGTVFMSLSEDVKAATLVVPGGPIHLLISRNIIGSVFYSGILPRFLSHTSDRVVLTYFLHQYFGFIEPTEYADVIKMGGKVGSYPGNIVNEGKRYLFQSIIGDAMVSVVGSNFLLRSINGGIFRGHVYEKGFVLFNTKSLVQSIRQINLSLALIDPYTYLPYQDDGEERSSLYSSYHLSVTPSFLNFYNMACSALQLLRFKTHEIIRQVPVAMEQVKLFFAEYTKAIYDDGTVDVYKIDIQSLVKDLCEGHGCWDLQIKS
jgi:hypothetical protein